jgi:hypothetical protein
VVLECAKIGQRVAPLHGMKNDSGTCGDAECDRPGRHLRTPNGIEDATSKATVLALISRQREPWPWRNQRCRDELRPLAQLKATNAACVLMPRTTRSIVFFK